MSGLKHRDLEQLDAAVVEMLSNHDSGIGPLVEPVRSAVEAIVTRAVNEALTEAADAIEARFDAATSTYPHDPFCLDEASTTTTEAERNGWLSGLRSAMALVRARTN